MRERQAEVILDVKRMVQEALVFDYSGIDVAITERAWIPAYCQVYVWRGPSRRGRGDSCCARQSITNVI